MGTVRPETTMVVVSQGREGERRPVMWEDARSERGNAEDLQVLSRHGDNRDTVLQGYEGCAGKLDYCSEGVVGDVGNKYTENGN